MKKLFLDDLRTSYMAEVRIKEIDIRKVLGAPVFHITALLYKDFATLVVIAALENPVKNLRNE